MPRKYYGQVRATVWTGPKSTGMKLDSGQAVDLAVAVLTAAQAGRPFEITAHHAKPGKDGRYQVTVTAQVP